MNNLSNEDIIWQSTLDNRYTVKVVRKDEYAGLLTVSDGTTLLLEKLVTLSYGARFGQDMLDIDDWCEIARRCVDVKNTVKSEE